MVLYGISGQTYKTQSAYTTTIFNYCGSLLRLPLYYKKGGEDKYNAQSTSLGPHFNYTTPFLNQPYHLFESNHSSVRSRSAM